MQPALLESAVLALLGLSGIALGLLMGVRGASQLALISLAAATLVRELSAFTAWTLDQHSLVWDTWITTSVALIIAALVFKRSAWREALKASLLFGSLGVTSLLTKYVFDFGERHHTDSADIVAIALVPIQGELGDLSTLENTYKRGIAYPLMLALGPSGRILGSFTPLVFLITLSLAIWLAWTAAGKRHPKAFIISSLAIAAFSASVPIVRAAMFYLNGHTLMAYSVLLLCVGLVAVMRQRKINAFSASAVLLGGAIGATTRIEGILLIAVLVAAIAGNFSAVTLRERVFLFMMILAPGINLSWWLYVLNSNAADRIGVPLWVLPLGTTLAALIVASKPFDSFRRMLFPAIAAVITSLIIWKIAASGDPLSMILAQWPNLGLGAGGWGTAAYMFLGSAVLLGWSVRSREYRVLLVISIVLIESILFSKTFDGGFGRAGFYDSVNRMWLHVLPSVFVASLIGYTEAVSEALTRSGRSLKILKKLPKAQTSVGG